MSIHPFFVYSFIHLVSAWSAGDTVPDVEDMEVEKTENIGSPWSLQEMCNELTKIVLISDVCRRDHFYGKRTEKA